MNRRLVPGIYLGVRGAALTGGRLELIEPDDLRAVDFLVEMRRYEEGRTLAALLERGELDRQQAAAVGGVLARFHAGAREVDPESAPVLAVEGRFERNLHELLTSIEQPARSAGCRRWSALPTRSSLAMRGPCRCVRAEG